MSDIKFGFHYGRIHERHPPSTFAPELEAMGFDSVWLAEGLVNEMPMLDILMAMSAFVHHSRELTVAGGVILLPLRHPAILAKELATLDWLSQGRIIVGFGVGGAPHSNPASFEAAGVKLSERGTRTDECIEIMTKLWSEKRVSHHGRHYQFNDICMLPGPWQRPHPPLWAGGTSAQMLQRTARWCDGFIPVDVNPNQYSEAVVQIENFAESYDRDISELTKAVHLFFRIGENQSEQRGKAQRLLNERRGFEVELPDDGRFLFGTVSDCLRVLESFIDMGVTHFVFNPLVELDELDGQLHHLSQEVLSRF